MNPLLHWEKSIVYSKCVFATLSIQHPIRMRPIVICGLSILQFISSYLKKAQL